MKTASHFVDSKEFKAYLLNSETYRKYQGVSGMCVDCAEWCDVLEPCCGTATSLEGSTLHASDLWGDIGTELEKHELERDTALQQALEDNYSKRNDNK